MLSKDNKVILDLYADLQKAATSLYLYPKGKTHIVFLNHALVVVYKLNDKRLIGVIKRLIKKVLKSEFEDSIKLADKILTEGLMLRNSV